MTKYGDFWIKVPKRFQTALRRCRTDQFLVRSGGIADAFHKSVREYDGSSDDQFREACMRATDPTYRDHMEFFQRHLDCLREFGLSDGEIVEAVAAQVCLVLQARGAA